MLNALRKAWNNGHTYDVPPSHAILQEQMETKFTPDVWWLSGFETQYVFVYDNNQTTFDPRQRSMILKGMNEATAYTKDGYVLYTKTLGSDSYPIAIRDNFSIHRPSWCDPIPGNPHALKGELWLLPVSEIFKLDNHYENGQAWIRKRISVWVPDRKKRVYDNRQTAYPMQDQPEWKQVRCWSYVGNPEVWKPMILEGDLFELADLHKPNKIKPFEYYYSFSPNKLNDNE